MVSPVDRARPFRRTLLADGAAQAVSFAAMAASKPSESLLLEDTFRDLQAILAPYSPPLQSVVGLVKNKRDYNLVTAKEAVIAGRKRDNLYFASVIEQKGYVGFYFMPIYCCPALRKSIPPELLKLLEGKSCFHVKALTPALKEQVRTAVKLGFDGYVKNGWV